MKEREIGALIGLLSNMRATLDAAIEMLENSGECQHPEKDVVNRTTMGAASEKWVCKACGKEATNRFFTDENEG
jgi:hypothetical protein